MRFESVTAHVFGPIRAETLDLAPGMNVIHGPNEAGKSTWHAALYAGLCGVRRARGQPRREDREFAERHRPWDGEGWEVGAVITLGDGRRIELRHDLAGGVDSSARDADIADRDYSNEIMNEGAPDGSRWLGLDRRSFLSTACVRQAQILAVRDGAGDLQDELQRAAATAGTDETAADALRLLRDYRAEHVGTERAPTRPLVRSGIALTAARQKFEKAQTAHAEYLQRRAAVEQLEREVEARERDAAAVRAVLLGAAADEAEARRDKAQLLSTRFPDGPPPRPSEEDTLTQQVVAALTKWDDRPEPRQPEGATIPELERQLAELDLQLAVIAGVGASRADGRFARVRELSAQFPEGGLRLPSEDHALTRQVAAALTKWDDRPDVHEPGGEPVDVLAEQIEEIDRQLAGAERPQRGGGGLGRLLRTILSALASLWRAVAGQREPPAAPPAEADAMEALKERRARIKNQINVRIEEEQRSREAAELREQAAEVVRQAALDAGAREDGAQARAAALRDWQKRRDENLAKADLQRGDWDELQGLLAGRTLDDLGLEAARLRGEANTAVERADPAALAAARERPLGDEALDNLGRQASEAQRVQIEHQIENRRNTDRAYADDSERYAKAASDLRKAARAVGSDADEPKSQVEGLRAWQKQRQNEMEEADHVREQWDELQRLLGERKLDELKAEADRSRREAERLASGLDASAMAAARERAPDEELRQNLDRRVRADREKRDTARGELTEFEQGLPDVAEAEELVASAETERDRVEELDRTLDRTIEFLEDAEERVHRDIAPVLRGAVREWLPRVTGGRYTDCRVDPQLLAVDVLEAEGRWRKADLLSHGTAEQLYLLLRLALAQHLTRPGETCPLILDDAVGASDSERKGELLETLLAIGESAQVILFTHEDDVRAWAQERLDGERNRLAVLAHDNGPA